MDIISNWNKGKKAHDDRVAKRFLPPPPPPFRVVKAECILKTIFEWSGKDSELEAKHWHILAEYAQDQIKELTKVSAVSLENGSSVMVYPEDVEVINGELYHKMKKKKSESVIERAEKRHGYGIQP